jgi:hypothetical protein
MPRPTLHALFLLLAALTLSGCQLFDPTYGMTAEEKAAYHAEQERLAAEFEARNIQDLTTPGEPHDEARDASLAGRFGYSWESDWTTLMLIEFVEGKRRKAETLVLFDNGSYARKLIEDERWGVDEDGHDWALHLGHLNEDVTRGQWKTEGNVFSVRDLSWNGGYGGWREWGKFQKSGDNFGLVDENSAAASMNSLGDDTPEELALQALADNTFAWSRKG